MPLSPEQDAYGQIYLALLEGRPAQEIMERDDGLIYCGDPSDYFDPFPKWPQHEQKAMQYVQGRVLDVGCGAGRVSLHLQAQGLEVVGMDESPLSIEVARRRGVRDCRALSLGEVDPALGVFDTILILRNNFGLVEMQGGTAGLLDRLFNLTSAHGRIITDSVDPGRLENPAHSTYAEAAQAVSPAGEVPAADVPHLSAPHFRVRFLQYATHWFCYLMFSPDEMRGLVAGSDWQLTQVLDDGSPRYGVVLEKR